MFYSLLIFYFFFWKGKKIIILRKDIKLYGNKNRIKI